MINRGLFVYRQPAPESLARIHAVQADYAAVPTFRPVEQPHLTLMRGDSLYRPGRTELDRVRNEGPVTAEDPYGMEVTEVFAREYRVDMGRCSIVLALNNEDGHFSDEHRHYMNLIRRSTTGRVRSTTPHVTIGYLNREHALDGITERAEAMVGESIEFGQIDSSAGPIRASRREVIRTPARIIPVDGSVRKVQPGSIPAGFLASLKPPTPVQ